MDISQAFSTLNKRFAETVNSHDTAGWVDLFTDDAVLVPADRAMCFGRKGLEQWAEAASKVWNHLEIQQTAHASEADVAWEFGSWRGNINVSDSQTLDVSGNFLLVARCDESDLRIKAHCWNVNTTTA
jgi:ketosteroid isomerase-like protein